MTIDDLNTNRYQDLANSIDDRSEFNMDENSESDSVDEDEVENSEELSNEESKSSGYTDLVCKVCGGTIWLIDDEYVCGHCRRKGYPNYDYDNEFFFDDDTSRINLTSIPEQTRVTKSKKTKKRSHK